MAKGGAPRVYLRPVTSKSRSRGTDGERWPFARSKSDEKLQRSVGPSRVGCTSAPAFILKKRQRSFSHPPQAKAKLIASATCVGSGAARRTSAAAEFVRLNTTKMAAVCHIVAQPSDSSSGARKMPPYACHARSQRNQVSDEQRASEGWKVAGGQEAWLPERSSPSALPTSTKTPTTGW